MSIFPVRVKIDDFASWKYVDDSQFLQAFQNEAQDVASGLGMSYESQQLLRNTVAQPVVNILVMTVGRMLRGLVPQLRLEADESATLESADIEVLVRIFETVGAEIHRRGDATPKV